MTESEIKYRKYRFNGEPELIYKNKNYCVVRNWGIDYTGRLIENNAK